MKLSKISKLSAIGIGLLASRLTGVAQTYIMPEQTLSSFGPGVLSSGNFVGGLNWGTGTLADTVVINPSAYSVEESGSLTLVSATSSFQITLTQMLTSVIQDFPNPPMTVTNPVSGTLTMSADFAGGTYSFDTGTRQLVWNGSSYTFNGETSIQVPVSISYSLVTGGQTYTGTDENIDLSYPLTLGDQLDVGNYPTSINIGPAPIWVNQPNSSAETIADFTAANGFQANIVAVVPEPGSFAILGSALIAFRFLKQRKP